MNDDSLKRLWQLKREATPPPASEDTPTSPTSPTSPAFVTRVAAAWAAERANPLALWERVTAGALALSLIICGLSAWLRPQPAEHDVMLTLFTARHAPNDDFPF